MYSIYSISLYRPFRTVIMFCFPNMLNSPTQTVVLVMPTRAIKNSGLWRTILSSNIFCMYRVSLSIVLMCFIMVHQSHTYTNTPATRATSPGTGRLATHSRSRTMVRWFLTALANFEGLPSTYSAKHFLKRAMP
jgi:hypothetical protein